MYAYQNAENNSQNIAILGQDALRLAIVVTDPVARAELQARAEGQERDQYACTALTIGVLCMRETAARVDVESIQAAGHTLLNEAKELISARGEQLIGQVSVALQQHFDPNTGFLPARIQQLVEKDGELEQLLSAYLGPESSALANSLSAYLSEESPLFKLLSPTEKEGIVAQVNEVLGAALTEQRAIILREFSLDQKDSALSRFLNEVTSKQGELNTGLQGKIDGVVKEFSLDHPNSALSRLVLRVENAQKSITEEFSTDNDHSALNKLSSLLQNTGDQLNQQLTLDNEQSSLSRLKRELQKTLDSIAQANAQFHLDVRTTLAAFEARKAEAARSTRHGAAFEEAFGSVLAIEAQKLGDIHIPTGTTPGAIRNCKKGDFVIELGPESAAPAAKIVWEAKEDQSWDLKKALLELEETKKNREAQIGIFVFSSKTAPPDLNSFGRYGNNIVIVWNAEDPSTDVLVSLVYSLARALVVRDQRSTSEADQAVREIELCARSIERQLRFLEEMQKWSETIKSNGEKIAVKSESVRKELASAMERLDLQVQCLKSNN